MPTLRVGIDGRAFASPAAGVRRYVTGLVSGLHALGESVQFVALGGVHEGLPATVEHAPEPWHPPTNLGWTLVGLPIAAARAHVDLIHAPAYTAPFVARVPVVLTIHDVSYARHPEWYPYRSDWLRRAFYRRSALSAAHVLTDSEFSAREIEAAYRIPRAHLTVVHLGCDHRAPSGSPVPTAVSTPYVLHVGDLHARRNLGVAIEAVAQARRRPGLDRLMLVLAGVDRGDAGVLRATAASAGVADGVVMLGDVTDAELDTLYRHALALVYPSLYEGFGLPVLEAMACGTPVIASRAASMPEVLGDAGILVDPRDTVGWSEAIGRVASDEALRARMQAGGRTRAATFTWEATARLTLDVYRRAVAGAAAGA